MHRLGNALAACAIFLSGCAADRFTSTAAPYVNPFFGSGDDISYWDGGEAKGPPSIKIDLVDQRAYFYDSVKMAQSATPVDLPTSSAEEAGEWLKQHIGLAATLHCPTGFKLLGTRSCRINNDPVGLLLFERDDRRLSCYVSRSSLTALHGYDGVTSEGIKLGTCEGRHVAAWEAGGVSYLLVTDLTKEAFLAVTSEVASGTSRSLKQ
jgi:hypothetical protein